MGSGPSTPLETDLSRFKALVLFTDAEITKLYRRFQRLGGDLETPIDMDKFISIPELKYNPFKYRFARVFAEVQEGHADPNSPTNNKHGAIEKRQKLTREQLLTASQDLAGMVMTFDGFLKFLSAVSYRSDLTTKTRLAFSLYDFDQDGNISTLDIECMLVLALGESQLHDAQYKQIAQEVMSEVDIDGNGTLTELEFSRVLSRLQDFEARMTLDIHF